MFVRVLVLTTACAALLWQPGASSLPSGDAEAHASLSLRSGHSQVARWNPCEPITYRVNTALAPENSLAEVQIAVARVARATGLTFHYAGPTAIVPGTDPGNYPDGTQLIIAWSRIDSTGVGGATYAPARTVSGADALMIDRGMVVLDAARTAFMPRGFDGAPGGTTGELLLHELVHAVCLAHQSVGDSHEIMNPELTGKAATWGAGDLAGLHAVGASGGCLTATADSSAAALAPTA